MFNFNFSLEVRLGLVKRVFDSGDDDFGLCGGELQLVLKQVVADEGVDLRGLLGSLFKESLFDSVVVDLITKGPIRKP